MEILLVAVNARYTHSSLSLPYLRESCQDEKWRIECREFTINDQMGSIMAEIYRIRPAVLCFSCYIWNMRQILELCCDYKQLEPDCLIVLGGPEVSYDAEEIMKKNSSLDIIISGEGEQTLKALLQHLSAGLDYTQIQGISCRRDDTIILNEAPAFIKDLSIIPSPYCGDMSYYRHKMVYYETSRGCPFNCSYCLSSAVRGVRYFPMERVKEDLGFLIENGVKKIKFVDRTFNCNEKRSIEIMKFLVEKMGDRRTTSFHFEVMADLFSEEGLAFLKDIPAGIFDFEIGVQSTCQKSLQAVNRNFNWDRLVSSIKEIQSHHNIHLHIDLIAGLPYEDYIRFGQSFNDVYQLQADVIQLGFLKLLKGTPIHAQRDKHQYLYQCLPPYEILANTYMTYRDLVKLHDIEELVEKYYNAGLVRHTLEYMVNKIYRGDAFALLDEFASYWRSNGLYDRAHRRDALYIALAQFVGSNWRPYSAVINEWLKYDYLINNRVYQVPGELQRYKADENQALLNSLLSDDKFLREYLPEMKDKSLREVRKNTYLEHLKINPLERREVDYLIPVIFLYDQEDKKCYRNIVLDPHESVV